MSTVNEIRCKDRYSDKLNIDYLRLLLKIISHR